MNKILTNIKYKTGYQLPWASWTVLLYAIGMFLIFYALINFELINKSEGSLVYRLWFLVIFQFAISMRFKEDFDFLLTLSSTRQEIFHSLLGVAIAYSVLFSGLIVIERVVIDYLNIVLGFRYITDPFHFISPYATDNTLLQFFYFLMLCVCSSVFGLLMGSLFYRFGKKFTLAFWLLLSAIPAVVFPLLLWLLYLRNNLSLFFSALGEYLYYYDLVSGAWVFFFLTIVFSIAAYLNIRRLPQI